MLWSMGRRIILICSKWRLARDHGTAVEEAEVLLQVALGGDSIFPEEIEERLSSTIDS